MKNALDDSDFLYENPKEKDWELFIGKNADYYIEKWQEIEQGKRFSLNIGALVFGLFWMIYRKMYLEHFALFGVLTVISHVRLYLQKTYSWIPEVLPLIMLVSTQFLMGIIANELYLRKANREIKRLKKETFSSPDNYNVALKTIGGTGLLVGLLVLLVDMFLFPLTEIVLAIF